MCQQAEAAGQPVEYRMGSLPGDAPALAVDALYQAVEELRQGGSRVFQLCTQVDLAVGCGDDLGEPDSPVEGGSALVGAMWDEHL